MPLDNWTNTGLSYLASGIDNSETSLTVVTDTGSRFPSADFQLVLWNSTDYDNPIDDPDREIVRVSRTGDVLTVERGQEDTSPVAHETDGKTYAVILAITTKFRDDINTLVEEGGRALQRERILHFDEEFNGSNTVHSVGDATTVIYQNSWRNNGHASAATVRIADVRGVIGLRGAAASGARIFHNDGAATLQLVTAAGLNPTLKFSCACVYGSIVANRRVGLWGALVVHTSNSDPADGIYIRFSNSGNYIAVCRASSSETTLDTGVAIGTTGTLTRFRFDITEQDVDVYVNETFINTISTNIPTVGLGPFGHWGHTSDGSGQGFNLDYFQIVGDRN